MKKDSFYWSIMAFLASSATLLVTTITIFIYTATGWLTAAGEKRRERKRDKDKDRKRRQFYIRSISNIKIWVKYYIKQVFLDLSLMVKMSLSDQRDMHDSLQLSRHLMFFKLFVVDFYLENPRWRTRDTFSVRTPEQYYPR